MADDIDQKTWYVEWAGHERSQTCAPHRWWKEETAKTPKYRCPLRAMGQWEYLVVYVGSTIALRTGMMRNGIEQKKRDKTHPKEWEQVSLKS